MLATLLATFLAMGVFSVALADEHRATRSISPTTVAPGGEITVNIALSAYGPVGNIAETLPGSFSLVSGSVVGGLERPSDNNNQVRVALLGAGVTNVAYKATAPSEAGGPFAFTGTFVNSDSESAVIGGDDMVTVAADATGGGGTGGNGDGADDGDSFELSPDPAVASDPVRIKLDVRADTAVPPGEDLTVVMKGWGLPSIIPESSVLILGTGNGAYSGEPAEVRIESGNKIVLSLTSRYVNGDPAGPLVAGQAYSIVFKASAGITNPSRAGNRYVISVDDLDGDDAIHTFGGPNAAEDDKIVIQSKVKLSKSAGPRGTQVVATAVGLSPGDATFYLRRTNYARNENDVQITFSPAQEDGEAEYNLPGYQLDKAVASGGTAVVTIDTTTQNFVPGTRLNNKGNTLQGLNQIWAVDGAGRAIDIAARFEVTPLLELDGDTFKRGGKVDITVSDWTYGILQNIKVGAVPVTEIPRGSSTTSWSPVSAVGLDEYEFSFIVPNSARLGDQELKLTGTTNNRQGSVAYADPDAARGTILVGAFDLAIDPSTAVTGQVIRIEGTGFEDNACIVRISIGGDVNIEESTSGNDVGFYDEDGKPQCAGSNENVESDSNGNLADTFVVPGMLKSGTYRVTVVDIQSRVGIADMTIPEPEIQLDPAASQRGSTVAVIGSNFPAEDVITISYRGRTVTASNTDTVGRFRGTFPVPVNAPIGEEHEVEAISADKADGNDGKATLKAKTLHRVPDEILEVSPGTAAPGTRITITAANLPLYTPVRVFIGNVLVAGSTVGELAESDGNGQWQGTPLVPQLTPGTHTVEMRVGSGSTGISVSTFLEIADIITRASEEAFDDLIENGTLTRVWYLDRETQAWSFFDPSPEFAEFNTLSEVSTGQIVTIIMNAQDTFEGQTLYVGSNPVSIE